MCNPIKKVNQGVFHSGWADKGHGFYDFGAAGFAVSGPLSYLDQGSRREGIDWFDKQVPWWREHMSWADPAGLFDNKLAEARGRSAENAQTALLKMQYDPAAPEKTAMQIGDPIEIRNRRRQAVLLGINQLRTPSGPGIATGGGNYSGASASYG